MSRFSYFAIVGALASLTACGDNTGATAQSTQAETALATTQSGIGPVKGSLEWAATGSWRNVENIARNTERHPVQTLAFFGLEGHHTVVEITPGGGWYTEVIAPYIAAGRGTYYAAHNGPAGSERFKQRFSDDTLFGNIQHSIVGPAGGGLAPEGSADMVLTFRNVHSWMRSGFELQMARDAYKALKPGGIFGVVEHRLPSTTVQDPNGSTGYVHEDYMKTIATQAGFQFVASSEINANPKDTADHPFGVWTLPPVSFTGDADNPAPADFDPQTYLNIGESDRFTLKFVKPTN